MEDTYHPFLTLVLVDNPNLIEVVAFYNIIITINMFSYDGGIPEYDCIDPPGTIEPEKNYYGGKKEFPIKGGGGNNVPRCGGIIYI